jgi:hypothetical protein
LQLRLQLHYRLLPDNYFTIDQSGSVSVRAALDLESMPVDASGVYTCTVVATTDSNAQTRTRLEVLIGDDDEFTPTFKADPYNIGVNEVSACVHLHMYESLNT